MIIEKSNTFVKTSEDFQHDSFSIESESIGLLFEMMQKSMYSDPVGAIAREIVSNCRDAHREVGNEERPVEIEYSNSIFSTHNKCIVLRDFGPGIGPERMKVLSKYVASTRRDSNKFTGGFGLGSKTPFSYTDSWVLRTVCDKVEYTYQFTIDETKIGKIFLINKLDVESENKTEVIIPLKNENDVDSFINKISYYTSLWSVRPKFIGIDEDDYNIIDYSNKELYETVIEDENMIVIKRIGYNHTTSLKMLVDEIPYPLNVEEVNKNIFDKERIVELPGHIVFIKFNTGELSISTNRENVHYNEKTIKAIKERFSLFRNKMIAYALDDLEKSENYLEALIYYNKNYSTITKVTKTFLNEDDPVMFRNQSLPRIDKDFTGSFLYGHGCVFFAKDNSFGINKYNFLIKKTHI